MRFYHFRFGSNLIKAALCLFLWGLAGCAIVGPSSVSMGRASYNEAINKTEDEQLLMMIVRSRYGELYSLLAVTGVAANVRFGTNAGVNLRFGDPTDYATNLVPISGGLIYEENPTITYAPVQGAQYMRQLMSPVSLETLLLFERTLESGGRLSTLLVNRINDMRNPDFLHAPGKADPRFRRFVELFNELSEADVLYLVGDPHEEVVFNIVISGYAGQYSKKVVEFLALLDLQMPADEPTLSRSNFSTSSSIVKIS